MAESPGKMYALAIVLTFLALVAIALRIYARRIKQAKLSWDDYMILPAMLLTFATAICMLVGASIGDLGRHTIVEQAPPEVVAMTGVQKVPVFTHRTEVFEQITYATQLTTTLTFALIKASVLFFYRRIFQGETFLKANTAMFCVIFCWTVGFFFSNLLQCWPININWNSQGGTSIQRCIHENEMYLAQAYSDVITDLMILALPLPCIWAMQLPIRHRIGVSCIFLLGILTAAAGAAKLVVLHRIVVAIDNGAADQTYIVTPSIYWPMIESSLGIVGACLPLLRPLFPAASSAGFVRKLRSVNIPTIHFNDTKSEEDTSEISFQKFGAGALYNEKYNYSLKTHGLLDERSPSGQVEQRTDSIV